MVAVIIQLVVSSIKLFEEPDSKSSPKGQKIGQKMSLFETAQKSIFYEFHMYKLNKLKTLLFICYTEEKIITNKVLTVNQIWALFLIVIFFAAHKLIMPSELPQTNKN